MRQGSPERLHSCGMPVPPPFTAAHRAWVRQLLALHRFVEGEDETHKVAGRLCKQGWVHGCVSTRAEALQLAGAGHKGQRQQLKPAWHAAAHTSWPCSLHQ